MLGGRPVTANSPFASVVYILHGNDPLHLLNKSSSGVLIRPNWVLTAAHCIRPGNPPNLVVGWDAGSPNAEHRRIIRAVFFDETKDPKDAFQFPIPVDVSRTQTHPPDYSGKLENDTLALLELESNFSRYQPATEFLYTPEDNDVIVISGIGAVDTGTQSKARYARLKLKPNQAGNGNRFYAIKIDGTEDGAGFPASKDSGGGWFGNIRNNGYRLIGITQGVSFRTGEHGRACDNMENRLMACGMIITEKCKEWIKYWSQPESTQVSRSTTQARTVFTLLGLSRPELRFYELNENLAHHYDKKDAEVLGVFAKGRVFAKGSSIRIELNSGQWESGQLVLNPGPQQVKIDIKAKGLNGKMLWWHGEQNSETSSKTNQYFIFLRTDGVNSNGNVVRRVLVHFYDSDYVGRMPDCLKYKLPEEDDTVYDPPIPCDELTTEMKGIFPSLAETPLQDDEGDGYYPPTQR